METPISHFTSNFIPLLQRIKNCYQNTQSTSLKHKLDNPNLQNKGHVADIESYSPQQSSFRKTTPGKAEKPFNYFTEHPFNKGNFHICSFALRGFCGEKLLSI